MSQSTMKNEVEIIKFLEKVQEVYGFYLDTICAYEELYDQFQKNQQNVSVKLGMTIEQLDQAEVIYGEGDPSKGIVKHRSTQAAYKLRIKNGGLNEIRAANFCVVLIHQYWEYYRRKAEDRLGLTKNDIKSDIMAELRHLRNSILKNNSFGNSKMKKCKYLKWFKEGESIVITKEKFKEIITKIQKNLLVNTA